MLTFKYLFTITNFVDWRIYNKMIKYVIKEIRKAEKN